MRKLSALLLLLIFFSQIIAKQPAIKPPSSLAFAHVTVIDMTGAPPRPDVTVVVTGNRIAAIGQTGKVRIPKDAQVIDATGKFLIPGLWDVHFHIKEAERTFPLFIANGVTGVRNMGGDFQKLFEWREAVASGRLLGLRLVACGPVIDGPNPANPDHAIPVSSAAEGKQAVDFLKRNGADFVKVYDSVPRDAYFAIVQAAKEQGLPLVGHIPSAITMSEASNAGQKSVEHLGTFLEGSSTAEIELRNWPSPPIRNQDFSVIPVRIAARGTRMLATYSNEQAAQLMALLARNNTWQVPTLLAKQVNAFVDDISKAQDPHFKYVPASVREGWSPDKNFFYRYRTPEFIAYQKRLFQKELEVVGEMNRAGVPMMAGTDGGPYTVAGFGLHQELALLVKAGLTPMQALQAATSNPARFLGESATLGTIEPGKIANLVLLEANPLENIRNTESISGVVVNGKFFPKIVLRMMLANVEKAANPR
ncbi:MAG: amidohydrolase family protein [Acidobacteriota bacterium]